MTSRNLHYEGSTLSSRRHSNVIVVSLTSAHWSFPRRIPLSSQQSRPGDIKPWNNFQRLVTRMVSVLKGLERQPLLQASLGANGSLDIKRPGTRGHPLKVALPPLKYQKRNHVFAPGVEPELNRPPTNRIPAKSVSMFKRESSPSPPPHNSFPASQFRSSSQLAHLVTFKS